MTMFRFRPAVSLDGFVAGPDQSEENPLGVGSLEWLVGRRPPVPHDDLVPDQL
jgi:hypothetical protein